MQIQVLPLARRETLPSSSLATDLALDEALDEVAVFLVF